MEQGHGTKSGNASQTIMRKVFFGFTLCLLCAMLFALYLPAEAQQQAKKIPRIAIVGGSQDTNNPWSFSNLLR
jgi:hypothetical protein